MRKYVILKFQNILAVGRNYTHINIIYEFVVCMYIGLGLDTNFERQNNQLH